MKGIDMGWRISLNILLIWTLLLGACSHDGAGSRENDDPWIWLENIDSPQSMQWVQQQNDSTENRLSCQPPYEEIYQRALAYYSSDRKLPSPEIFGDYIYDHTQNQDHPRGIWRRSVLKKFISGKAAWETLVDLDQLSAAEHRDWVFSSALPKPGSYDRWLVELSPGGGDAAEIREFDMNRKIFITNGFHLPVSKGSADWYSPDTLIVSRDFGSGSMTQSGYPRSVALLPRGKKLKKAERLITIPEDHMGVWGSQEGDLSDPLCLIQDYVDFFHVRFFLYRKGQLLQLPFPDFAEYRGLADGQFIVQIKENWNTETADFSQGDVLGFDVNDIFSATPHPQLIAHPGPKSAFLDIRCYRNGVLILSMENVKSAISRFTRKDGMWQQDTLLPPMAGTLSFRNVNRKWGNFFFTGEDFLTPPSLFYSSIAGRITRIDSLPAFFDKSNLDVTQSWALSSDGTKIPYFLLIPRKRAADGTCPTLLYGYGGFEIAERPRYNPTLGFSWLEKGGAYALANIRGGGEFGPSWHQSALREHRQRAFDDFIAVAEDLLRRGLTTPQQLAIQGGSNGGLLVGAVMTQRPDLFKAVVCRVPLLDMKRYSHLLAGASWMAEYGDPDTKDWDYMKLWSPYQNLKSGTTYPDIFFNTSTRDDRVHPGHARKMAAKMESRQQTVYYFENTEGGHRASVTPEQKAKTAALIYSFLLSELGLTGEN